MLQSLSSVPFIAINCFLLYMILIPCTTATFSSSHTRTINFSSCPLFQPSNSLIQDSRKQAQQNDGRHDQIQLKELETATDIIAYPNVNRYFAASLLHFLWMSHAEDNILSKALPVPISLPVRRMEHYTSTAYRYKYLPSIPE